MEQRKLIVERLREFQSVVKLSGEWLVRREPLLALIGSIPRELLLEVNREAILSGLKSIAPPHVAAQRLADLVRSADHAGALRELERIETEWNWPGATVLVSSIENLLLALTQADNTKFLGGVADSLCDLVGARLDASEATMNFETWLEEQQMRKRAAAVDVSGKRDQEAFEWIGRRRREVVTSRWWQELTERFWLDVSAQIANTLGLVPAAVVE